MLEAGLIDYGHHANFAKKAFEEALELEKAVLKALELTKGIYKWDTGQLKYICSFC